MSSLIAEDGDRRRLSDTHDRAMETWGGNEIRVNDTSGGHSDSRHVPVRSGQTSIVSEVGDGVVDRVYSSTLTNVFFV